MSSRQSLCITAVAVSITCAWAGGCSTDGSAATDGSPSSVPCAALLGMRIAAAEIALPTSGGLVTGAAAVPAGASIPAHCLVTGSILPVDRAAPNIGFQVSLPVAWNGKAAFLGGSGFDGMITDTTGTAPGGAPGTLSPLARGYAVFGSDGGHESTAANPYLDGAALVNDEAYANWVGDSPKKTRDAAVQIIRAHYGAAPAKAYALGGSTGGRETLAAVSRFPADWDGAVAFYPARDVVVLGIGGYAAMAQALAAAGAFPDAAKRALLWDAVLAACDALDGATDGLVSDITGCNAIFDPATATLNGAALRCAGGTDSGDTCLSDAQIAAIKAINAPVSLTSPVASGETSFPGWNIYGAAQGTGGSSPFEPYVEVVDLGSGAPASPLGPTATWSATLCDGLMRFVLSPESPLDYLTFDVRGFGAHASRVATLSALDTADTDLSGFAAKGGKLVILQGTADMMMSARFTERYVSTIQSRLGASVASGMLRYYEVPGYQHGFSTVFNVAWDSLTALENWVERSVDPAQHEVVTDLAGIPGRTRPLCQYPAYPRYAGSGDVNQAQSFSCFSP